MAVQPVAVRFSGFLSRHSLADDLRFPVAYAPVVQHSLRVWDAQPVSLTLSSDSHYADSDLSLHNLQAILIA